MLRDGVLSTFRQNLVFEDSTDVRPLTWNCSRTPQRCGVGRHRQSAVSKGLFNDTNLVAGVAPLKSLANKSPFRQASLRES